MKKKSFRDIRNAVFMLCIMLAMLSTATFAWFSMNDRVSAESMTVTAKADSATLMIKAGLHTAAEVQAAPENPAETVNEAAALYPVAHEGVTNKATAAAAASWYYMYSDDPADSEGKAESKKTLAAASKDMTDYMLMNDFSITVAEGSNPMTDLIAEATITPGDSGAQAVKVLVVSDTGYQEFDGTGSLVSGSSDVLAATVDGTTAVQIRVYVYWDGNNEAVYTNNMVNLKDTVVELEFSATPGATVTP